MTNLPILKGKDIETIKYWKVYYVGIALKDI